MRFARPIIDHIEKEERHDDYSLLLKKYLELYEQNGGLTPEEEQEFLRLDRESSLAWRKSRLT
ncbi:hypothetical protein [Mucilaginibacter sp. SG564]|uniref:hypothetical protein n=1 Tax=Mucilaginibacter sp. SG564 TaxID=2587022 RepID=UPI001553706D|nr:hypothetical protein [Mucilaginibacter sp. SG564]NOW94969.1 hypothetical protein [Mucilaginibacter sp. SG564]